MVPTQERFIVVSDVLTDNSNMVILTNITYWANNEEGLRNWCKDNNSEFVGMTVVFPNKPALTAFCLKWS